ncbi:unnamed protein product [Mesocestoides corti]|uniref:Non-specific serine/threonine protein kinase n=1 Tax=Mesocestoides corti TaxID=53468 RepID=A0A0R3UJ13_MESCO|nr:unnamed protein product [Mesocestoides corti]
MDRSLRQLTNQARRSIASSRISRSLTRFAQSVYRSLPTRRSSLSESVNFDHLGRRLREVFLPSHHRRNYDKPLSGRNRTNSEGYADEKGDNPITGARTRRAKQRPQSMRPSTSQDTVQQILSALQQAGLTPQRVGDDRLTLTWPMETDIDAVESREPLAIELQVCSEQGVKFRRLTGSEDAFRKESEGIVALIHSQCGW